MEKPLCRTCEKRHWSYEPHVFSEEPSQEGDEAPEAHEVAAPDVSASPDPGEVPVVSKETGQVARNRRWRQKNRERYNKYMRDYRRGKL